MDRVSVKKPPKSLLDSIATLESSLSYDDIVLYRKIARARATKIEETSAIKKVCRIEMAHLCTDPIWFSSKLLFELSNALLQISFLFFCLC